MTPLKPKTLFCSKIAHEHPTREPLLGTAHQVSGVIAITWPRGLWGRQHFKSRDLPSSLVDELKRIQRDHRYFVRLIDGDRIGSTLQVYVAPENRYLRATSIGGIETALVEAFSSEKVELQARNGWKENTKPLLLVCTNGARDRCCAKFGFAVYKEALRRQRADKLPIQVFQSTHLTGDRFAACALVLPSGDLYGWLRQENVGEFLSSVSEGEVHLPLFRGNSYLSERDQIVTACIRARRKEVSASPCLSAWTVEYRQESDQTIAEIWQTVSSGLKVLVGRIVLREERRSMFVDCDGLDRAEQESLPRRVLASEDWLGVDVG